MHFLHQCCIRGKTERVIFSKWTIHLFHLDSGMCPKYYFCIFLKGFVTSLRAYHFEQSYISYTSRTMTITRMINITHKLYKKKSIYLHLKLWRGPGKIYLWKNDRFSLCWDPGGAAVPLETPSPSFLSLEGATLPFLPALLGAILQTGLMGRWPDPTMAIDGRPWQGSRSAAITFSHLYRVEFFPRQNQVLCLSESVIQTHLRIGSICCFKILCNPS